MSTATAAANSILDLIYRAIAWADLAQDDGSGPATTLSIALHTASPVGGVQTSNEATYGGYARVNVTRGVSGWNAPSGGSLSNASLIQFVECASGSSLVSHISVGYASGTIIHFGSLSANRSISAGIQPQFAASSLVSTIT